MLIAKLRKNAPKAELNKALALQKGRLEDKQICLSYNKLASMLPAWKKEHPFLADAPSQALQQTLKALDKAITEAFNKANPKQFAVLLYLRSEAKAEIAFDIHRVLISGTAEFACRKSAG